MDMPQVLFLLFGYSAIVKAGVKVVLIGRMRAL